MGNGQDNFGNNEDSDAFSNYLEQVKRSNESKNLIMVWRVIDNWHC